MPYEAYPTQEIIDTLEVESLRLEDYRKPYTVEPFAHIREQLDRWRTYDTQYSKEYGNRYLQDVVGRELAINPHSENLYLPFGRGSYRTVSKEEYIDSYILGYTVAFGVDSDAIAQPVTEYFLGNSYFVEAVSLGKDKDIERRDAMEKFLLGHVEFCDAKAERLTPTIEAARNRTIERVHQLVADGVLPGTALEKIGLIRDMPITFSDEFDAIEGGLLGGSFDVDAYKAKISIFWPEERIEEIVTHELVHALSGVHLTRNLLKVHDYERIGLFMTNSTDDIYYKKTKDLNEAVTQTITNLIMNPHMSLRRALVHGNIYIDERVDLLSDFGAHIGAIRKLFEAYFHDDLVGEKVAFTDHINNAVELSSKSEKGVRRKIRVSLLTAEIVREMIRHR